jgi:hypothetical protein
MAGSRYRLLAAPGALDALAVAGTLIISRLTLLKVHRRIGIFVVL